MQLKKPYLLFAVAGLLIIIVLYFVLRLVGGSPEGSTSPSPTPSNLSEEQGTGFQGHGEEPPFPSPNPTYIELLKTQPFWDLLPYRTDTYLIEHIMHNNTIQITTIIPGTNSPEKERLIENYREDARDWLTQNGANLDQLRIIYKP